MEISRNELPYIGPSVISVLENGISTIGVDSDYRDSVIRHALHVAFLQCAENLGMILPDFVQRDFDHGMDLARIRNKQGHKSDADYMVSIYDAARKQSFTSFLLTQSDLLGIPAFEAKIVNDRLVYGRHSESSTILYGAARLPNDTDLFD